MSSRPSTEQVLAHAELAAVYLRSLVTNGVPIQVAGSMAATYVQGIQIIDGAQEPPKEPWQKP